MPTNREGFTVRVLRSGSTVSAGIGFVVGDRHVMTCAHVVNTALGRKQREQGNPGADARIQVDFPMLGDAEGAPVRNCRVDAWEPPPESGLSGGDVAGLVLVGEGLPEGAGPARLVEPVSVRDVSVAVFGYPGDPPRQRSGAWSAHRLAGAVGAGVIQLDHDSGSAISAQPGYSGSPAVVAGEAGDAVIGMLAVAGRDEDARDAYAVPVSQLVIAWPDVLEDRTVPDCPYRGLRSFTAKDADEGLFVGREEEIARLRLMVGQQPLVMVAGPSGVGKSSLVSAGLIPALTREGWAAATYRPGGAPFEALAKVLLELERPGQPLAVDDLDQRVGQLLSDGLTRLGPQLAMLKGGEVLLCADQLEEIFDPVICPHEMGTAFLGLILGGCGSGRVHMICTLRSDFFTQLLKHPGAGALIQHQLFGLSPMTREQLERIIVEPAQERGVRYESGLAQLIARDAGGGDSLPMLEFALTELWPHQRRRQITLAEYQGLGGVTGALTHRADHVFTELAASWDEDRIRRVLLAMVRSRQGASEATRRVATREQLGTDWPVAEMLAEQRLVVLDHDTARQQDTAELAHEALIREWPRLRAWVDADADFQRWLMDMEERFGDDDLLSEARIGEADRWLTERLGDIPREVVSLIERSKSDWLRRMRELEEARARAEEAARQAEEAARRAEKAAQEAEARRLAAAAELALASRGASLQVPIALAVESLRMAPLLEADIAARHAIRIAALQISRLDNDDTVKAVAFSPDGKCVAIGSWDGSAAVFNASTGAEMCRLDHDREVNAVAFSPDGKCVATGSDDGSARVFDAATGVEMCRLEHDGPVSTVAFSPDGKCVATGSDDGSARVFDAATGAGVCRVDHDRAVSAVAFSRDGMRVATASRDNSARVFDAATGAEVCRVDHDRPVGAVAFSPDGAMIVTGSADKSARVFDVAAGSVVCRLDHDSEVKTVAFSPVGRWVATGSADKSARVFDVAAGSVVRRLDHDSEVNAVMFSPDGTRLATASRDGSARVFDAAAGTELCRLDHDSEVNAVAFSLNGTQVATGSDDGSARVFKAVTGAEISRLDHGHTVNAVAFSPDGTRVATGSRDGSARVFDAGTGDEIYRLRDGRDVTRRDVYAVAFSPDGTRVATGSADGSARVFDTATGAEMCRLDHAGTVWTVAFSPDGRGVATGSADRSARVFDAATGIEVCRLDHRDDVYAITFSPDGARVATGSADGSARVFDPVTSTEMCRLNHVGAVAAVDFSPDRTRIATGSSDNYARVFDAATGAEVSRLDHDGIVWAVAFSPDGTRVATASRDGSARVFDAATGSEVSRLDHGSKVNTVTFSSDGTRVATGSDDGSARVFDAATGTEISRLDHGGAVYAVAFDPDGTRIATGSEDRSARVWIVDHSQLIQQVETRLTRNLTGQEWRRYFRDEPYRKTRADLQ